MSDTTKKIITRQWQIIDYLLQSTNYVSTSQIQSYLEEKGMEAEMRTIQRDLKLLQEVIPLECRTDDKPYSWRWQRIDKTTEHQLSLTQAVAFRLIETELKEHIPTDLMNQLEPILMKARFVLAMANVPESVQHDITTRFGKGRHGHPHGFVQPNPLNQVVLEVQRIFDKFSLPKNPLLSSSAKFNKADKVALKELEKELKKLDVPELIEEIQILL